MTELVVCSGKGGTGKTSVLASFAALAHRPVLADSDVDAANLHLVLDPVVEATHPFSAGRRAAIRPGDCAGCGECRRLCRFSAIDRATAADGREVFRIDPLACEGCGVCVHFCPEDAIDFSEREGGRWHLSRTRFGPLVHARLAVGGENSGKLVSLVREQARRVAAQTGRRLVLVDGPPGIGCPVTATLTGADHALIVTEPSLSGLHDLQRVLDLAEHFAVPVQVCINKFDLSVRLTRCIRDFCAERGLAVVGMIPHEPLVGSAQTAGRSLVEYAPDSRAALAVKDIWNQVSLALTTNNQRKG